MIDKKYANTFIREAVSSCLLCKNTPCSLACEKKIDCGKIISSLRFENYAGAYAKNSGNTACMSCTTKECMKSCTKGKIGSPIPIPEVLSLLGSEASTTSDDVSLSVDFMGVKCENPFFLSSSVVASNYEMIAKAFNEGWAGVAFKTIGAFVPDEVSPRFSSIHKEANSFVGFKNIEQISDHTLEENLECIKQLKKDFPTKIIIASIMGRSDEEWEMLARKVQEANADIIECNFSCPNMTAAGLGSDVGQSPELVAQYTKAVRRGSTLPILAKMTPNLGHMEIPAIAAIESGADGIAAINTIKSVMNVDLSTFSSKPSVCGLSSIGGYSGKAVKPIALRFITDMKKCEKLKDVAISGMGGIETWLDAAEFMALGCETIQVTTAVMQYGYRIVKDMIDGMKRYLSENNMTSVKEIIGKAISKVVGTDALERSTIAYPKFLHDRCVGCGRCVVSCFDGGHQALSIQETPGSYPVMNPKKCVGCQLCLLVCPTEAIVSGSRVLKSSIGGKL